VSSKKHWSPGGEVSVQSGERSDAGGWVVSGNLAPNGICPDWYFEEFLSQSWKDGIRTGSALFRLLRERGYEGSPTHLRRLLAGWRRAEKQAKGPALERHILKPVQDPETGHAISPVIAAALCIKPCGKLTPDPVRKVDALEAGFPAFATMRCLAIRFNGILRGREADPLPAWIDDTIEADLAPIVRFARTLNRDFDAVKNAVEMPWSNGQAEGQINRLKTLKRAMYGRAGPARQGEGVRADPSGSRLRR
jgi:hypothetical protein